MAEWQDADYRSFCNALRRLAAQPALIGKLKSNETAAQAMSELRISDDVRVQIINILNDLEVHAR